MNLSTFAATFVVFFVTHGIADYWVQTDWQAQNKSKNPVALWRHVLTYSVTFVPALIFLGLVVPLEPWQIPVALLTIALPHAALDNRKLITWFCAKTKGWRPDNKVAVPLVPDQVREQHGIDSSHTYHTLADLQFCPAAKGRAAGTKVYVRDVAQVLVKANSGAFEAIEAPAYTLRDLNPGEIAVRFHVTIALDQKAHFFCLALVAAWLAF